nr:ABC transporter permease subunit [uncultured Dongia sp.]
MKFDVGYMIAVVMPQLIWAIPMTLTLTIVCAIIGNALAIPVALARLAVNPILWIPARLFILLMRGTPLLVQLYFIYYGVGQLIPGWMMRGYPFLRDGIWYAIFALSINTAGYTGEILRGALLAVPYGEIEAARAFGMSRSQVFWRVRLPRAIRICLPTMSSETILLLKATSLASLVTVNEVLRTANTIRIETYRVYDTLIGAAIVYFIIVYGLTRGLNWLERRLNRDRLAIPSTIKSAVKA